MKFPFKMLSKFAYPFMFLLLTILHVCAHLYTTIEANASVKAQNGQLDRKLNLNVGYEYQPNMLWLAIVNSLLLLVGIGLYQGSTQNISKAAEVKLDWLRKRSNLITNWQLFPMRNLVCCAMPWLLIFMYNTLINSMLVHMVMKHFCISTLEMGLLYARIQLLFITNFLVGAVEQANFKDAFESLITSHAGSIIYESRLLVDAS